MSGGAPSGADSLDDMVDDEIYACLDLVKPTSFFLYAGAGSGKTRSLVNAVTWIAKSTRARRQLLLHGRRVAVITYTNAACDEIKQRLEFDSLVDVSTIHSFAWLLIGTYHSDIRAWLRVNLAEEIKQLELAQAKGRLGTKAANDREQSIASKRRRLAHIETVKRFAYSPNGDNNGKDSLNHSEVIKITSDFLKEKDTLQRVLVDRYPVMLIDESQDTNRLLMDAFLMVQERHGARLCLGLFGDTMQRIYADGKVGLSDALPKNWARPVKRMNHRCPHRIIRLINRIRAEVDGQEQRGRTDKPDGFARLFVLSNTASDKSQAEASVARRMSEITGDPRWASEGRDYKTLILEHHMAAKRMGFDAMFEPLYAVDRFRTGLLDGSLPGIRFFSGDVLPLVNAGLRGDQFAVAALVRSRSPLLEPATLKSANLRQLEQLRAAKLAVDHLMRLWDGGEGPTLLAVLLDIAGTGLFSIPEALQPIARRGEAGAEEGSHEAEDDTDMETRAWELALATPFRQMTAYAEYVSGRSPIGTHQGVKGLEFPRVMVIINDEDSRGFMFSYEKLFGAKEKSATDLKNESEGAETSIDRTRRLFYVTCSRAEESLAIVAYSEQPSAVRARAISEQWFSDDEIELVN